MWDFLQKHMTWRAVPVAALAAGTVFLLVMILATPFILDVSPTLILHYMASLVMGAPPLTPVIGVLVHYVLSFIFTLIITIVIHRWGLLVGVVGGGVLGLAFYVINFYTMTLFFEWFFAISGEVWMASHILFGMTAGGVYELFDHYDAGLNPPSTTREPRTEGSAL